MSEVGGLNDLRVEINRSDIITQTQSALVGCALPFITFPPPPLHQCWHLTDTHPSKKVCSFNCEVTQVPGLVWKPLLYQRVLF